MTKKLYDDDAYATGFLGEVIRVREHPDGGDFDEEIGVDVLWDVVLDQTLFFPEEGGQTPDKGTLCGYPVVDVQIKDETITHTLSLGLDAEETDILSFRQAFLPGKKVEGKIDWRHRFSNMQQHTGEHIFSGLVHKTYGYENVGFHLSDSIVTMDYDGSLTSAQVRELEWQANLAIVQNHPIRAEYPDADTLEKLSYRSKKELSGPIRIVTIEGVDVCACCAPHVHTTGEVGILKVLDVTAYKGGVRLSILCGFRALLDYRTKQRQVYDISHLASSPSEEVVLAVEKLKEEIGRKKQEVNEARDLLLKEQILRFESDEKNKGSDHILLFTADCDMNHVRKQVNELTKRYPGYVCVFCEKDAEGSSYNYLIASQNCDCKSLLDVMQQKWNAKGGGKPEMIQGSLSAGKDDISNNLLL